MGNYRFRLSDMMPNAWFYKLKDMGNKGRKSQTNSRSMKKCCPTTRTSPSTPQRPSTPPSPEPKEDLLPRRGSYYISSRVETEKFPNSPFHLEASDTHFLIDLPRRSKRRSRRKASKASHTTKLVTTSSVSADCSCTVWKSETVTDFPADSPESRTCDRLHCIHGRGSDLHKPIISNKIEFDGFDGVTSWSHSCSFWVTTSATDIIIELGTRSSISRKLEKVGDVCNVFSEHGLPRILTKPAKKEAGAVKLDNADMYARQGVYHNGCSVKEPSKSAVNKSRPGFQRHRMRESSPRIVGNGVEVPRSRKSSELAMTAKGLRESFAIIISSSDPQRDFRDSMVEMIVENNIRASKDLEELLACYLSLNSKEYHDVIVKVFEQIWFDLTNIRL